MDPNLSLSVLYSRLEVLLVVIENCFICFYSSVEWPDGLEGSQ